MINSDEIAIPFDKCIRKDYRYFFLDTIDKDSKSDSRKRGCKQIEGKAKREQRLRIGRKMGEYRG